MKRVPFLFHSFLSKPAKKRATFTKLSTCKGKKKINQLAQSAKTFFHSLFPFSAME
jgi:hypothetical protein